MTRHAFLPFQVQDKLLLSACHLLVSLATTVRPVFLISIPAVQKVFNRVTDASAQRLVDKVGAGGPVAGGQSRRGLLRIQLTVRLRQSAHLGHPGRASVPVGRHAVGVPTPGWVGGSSGQGDSW